MNTSVDNAVVYVAKRRTEIGSNIRILRRRQGWTQERLAEVLGCSRKRINRAEQGHIELAVGELELLAQSLNAGVTQLMGWA